MICVISLSLCPF